MKIPGWARTLVRPLYYRIYYEVSRGTANLNVGGVKARFYVSSVHELLRARKLAGEKDLLSMILRHIQLNDIVFDIGANMGTHTIPFGLQVGPKGRVVAFEPEPATAERLRRNVALNNLDNIDVVESALGDSPGASTLYVDERPASGRHRLAAHEGWREQWISVVVGDSLVSEGQFPAPNVIKIDVEGAELGVLNGLRRTLQSEQCRLVICEVHPSELMSQNISPSEIADILRNSGFDSIESIRRGSQDHLIASKGA